MAPITPNPKSIHRFRSAEAFEAWLSGQHDRADEVWIRIYKKTRLARGETVVPESRRKR